MTEVIQPIPARLKNVAVGGHVAGAADIIDDTLNKDQATINSEVQEALGTGGSVDEKIASAVNTEKTRAQVAEEALDGRVDTLEDAVGTGGSIDSRISTAVNAAKSEIKGNATSACDTLGEAEALISAEATRAQAAEDNRYTKTETYSKTELNNMITTPNQEYVSVIATAQTTAVTDVLPAAGAADTTYRVGNWDGTQYNDSVFSEYAWNGTAYIKLSTKSQVGEVYDISANHADTKYADLAAALGTDGANIPQNLRKGGMSVKFVQSSDNKYVQWRYLGTAVTGNPNPFLDTTNWQGVDDTPTAGSDNLVKSGGVFNSVLDVIGAKQINNSISSFYTPISTEVGRNYIVKVVLSDAANLYVTLTKTESNDDANRVATLIEQRCNAGAVLLAFIGGAEKYIRVSADNNYTKVSSISLYDYDMTISQLEKEIQNTNELIEVQGIWNNGYAYKDGTKPMLDISSTYVITPFIEIDKDSDIDVYKCYETTSQFAPLCFYDKNLNFISWTDNAEGGQTGGSDPRTFVLPKELIPANAVYFVALGRRDYEATKYVKNGILTAKRLINGIILSDGIDIKNINSSISQLQTDVNTLKSKDPVIIGDLFYIHEFMNKLGEFTEIEGNAQNVRTDYILIDTTKDIEVYRCYATLMTTSLKLSPFNFYDKDFNFIEYRDNASVVPTGTDGIKSFTIPKETIPENAVYFVAAASPQNATGYYVKNGDITAARLFSVQYKKDKDLHKSIEDLTVRVSDIENDHTDEIEMMANRYDAVVSQREMYLRQLYHYNNIGKWYGVRWTEESNAHNITDIYSEGDEALCEQLPIQNKMRRCVVKDGAVQYYLDNDNSLLKENGTPAVLDGTDGNVMVEIPEFFYKWQESVDANDKKVVDLKISEFGIDGFNYSPKCYTSIGFATLDRENNYLVSVISAIFSVTEQEITIASEGVYKAGNGYSLGSQKLVQRTGFAANASKYRGGNQNKDALVLDPVSMTQVKNEYFDNATDPSVQTFCLNKLGNGISQVQRSQCRSQARMWKGETMYLYDVQKALFILSSVEFKTKNIQDAINVSSPRSGGLGVGATVYPNYDAYENFFSNRGNACIPNGVTLCLGNHSGEVYYKMPQVPTSYTNGTFGDYTDVYMPVMSYRGVENFYGHLYSCADQISVRAISHGNNAYVDYHYQKNPFKCKTNIDKYEYIGRFEFKPTIQVISSVIGGFDGHILPCMTDGENYTTNYCDCSEIAVYDKEMAISYNGRLVSNDLSGRNFIVAMWADDEMANRASESTRLCAFIL